MRDIREGNCPLCDHHEITEVIPAEFGGNDLERLESVTYEVRWMLPGRNPTKPIGELRKYVCRSCGFTQEFTLKPSSVPDTSEYTRTIVGVNRKDTEP